MNSNVENHPELIKCTQKIEHGDLNFISKVCLPAIIYAILATFCRYFNAASILLPVWAIGTLVFIYVVLKRLGQPLNRQMIFPSIALVLFATSSALTTNIELYTMNNLLSDGLIILICIRAFYPGHNWQMFQWLIAGVKAIFGAIGELGDWSSDIALVIRNRNKKSGRFIAVLIGLAVAIPLTFIIVSILASADTVFRHTVESIFSWDLLDWIPRFLMFVFVYLGAYCGIRYLNKKRVLVNERTGKQGPVLTAYVILAPLTIIYMIFAWIQFGYLFIGNLKLPKGVTYSEYAHQGFDQLLVVVAINLILVLLAVAIFGRNKGLQALLSLFTACTYVMIASAFIRIFMYIGVYHLTRLRLLVVWGLGTFAILFLVVLVYIFVDKFNMARWFFFIGTFACLALSYCRMDTIIAGYNISHIPSLQINHAWDEKMGDDSGYSEIGAGQHLIMMDSDTDYLAMLSTDATDAIMASGNEKLIQAFALWNDHRYQEREYGWREINLSYEHYKKAIKGSKYEKFIKEAIEEDLSGYTMESTDLSSVVIKGYTFPNGHTDIYDAGITRDDVIEALGDEYVEDVYDYPQGLYQIEYTDAENYISMIFVYVETDQGDIINWVDVTK